MIYSNLSFCLLNVNTWTTKQATIIDTIATKYPTYSEYKIVILTKVGLVHRSLPLEQILERVDKAAVLLTQLIEKAITARLPYPAYGIEIEGTVTQIIILSATLAGLIALGQYVNNKTAPGFDSLICTWILGLGAPAIYASLALALTSTPEELTNNVAELLVRCEQYEIFGQHSHNYLQEEQTAMNCIRAIKLQGCSL